MIISPQLPQSFSCNMVSCSLRPRSLNLANVRTDQILRDHLNLNRPRGGTPEDTDPPPCILSVMLAITTGVSVSLVLTLSNAPPSQLLSLQICFYQLIFKIKVIVNAGGAVPLEGWAFSSAVTIIFAGTTRTELLLWFGDSGSLGGGAAAPGQPPAGGRQHHAAQAG